MAFLDKLSSVARGAADKAGELVEITKLNGKIAMEKDKISNAKKAIGAHYYEKFQAGTMLDAEVAPQCEIIVAAELAIKDLEKQIEAVKAE